MYSIHTTNLQRNFCIYVLTAQLSLRQFPPRQLAIQRISPQTTPSRWELYKGKLPQFKIVRVGLVQGKVVRVRVVRWKLLAGVTETIVHGGSCLGTIHVCLTIQMI